MDLLAFLFLLPSGRPQHRTDPQAWQQLQAAFSERGVAVVSDHPRCREPDLDGLYHRGRREVVVCERGDRSLTLRHEGWHLVQSLCLRDRPWLGQGEIARRLTRQDRQELQRLVRPELWLREAEARVMAQLPNAAYLEQLDRACSVQRPGGSLQAAPGPSLSPQTISPQMISPQQGIPLQEPGP
jgi:hypothetical protein